MKSSAKKPRSTPTSALSYSESEDSKGTPRKASPRRSTVKPLIKSQDLSLSDTAEVIKQRQRRRSPVMSDVVVIQADDKHANKSGEVETRSFTMQSPVKVIRHSLTPSPPESPPSESEEKAPILKKRPSTFNSGSISPIGKRMSKSLPTQNTPNSDDKSLDMSKRKNSDSKNLSLPKKDSSHGGTKKKKVYVQSRYKQTSKKLTSTPYLMTSMYDKQTPQDGTILDQLKETSIKEQPRKKISKKDFKVRKDVQTDVNREDEPPSDADNDNEKLLVDLHYARLLQISFLNLKARETAEIQEQKAKQEIYALWGKNRKLEKEIEALKLSLYTKKIEFAVDQLIQSQIDKLKPLDEFAKKCLKLDESLSNILHYLPISNVHIDPKELVNSLVECERYLTKIGLSMEKNSSKVEQFGQSCKQLSQVLHEENKENQRCRQSLLECKSLNTRERSLLSQRLQENRSTNYIASFYTT